MLKKVIIGMFVCSCITHSLYAAALTSSVEKKEGTVYVTIENPFLTLTFNPAQGGSCTRFFIKATGEEIIGNKKYAGMFKDHWAKYTWPSGL